MTDQLISFKTAKLAKEKGFTWDSGMVEIDKRMFPTLPNKIKKLPTQSLLQRWLREEHNIHVWVTYYYPKGQTGLTKLFNMRHVYVLMFKNGRSKYKTYEEALERGLQEALKTL